MLAMVGRYVDGERFIAAVVEARGEDALQTLVEQPPTEDVIIRPNRFLGIPDVDDVDLDAVLFRYVGNALRTQNPSREVSTRVLMERYPDEAPPLREAWRDCRVVIIGAENGDRTTLILTRLDGPKAAAAWLDLNVRWLTGGNRNVTLVRPATVVPIPQGVVVDTQHRLPNGSEGDVRSLFVAAGNLVLQASCRSASVEGCQPEFMIALANRALVDESTLTESPVDTDRANGRSTAPTQ